MRRYLRLYACFLRFSASRAMEFRVDFFFRVVMDLAYYAIYIGFYKVVFLHTDTLGGWTAEQAMVFMAGFLVVDAINMTVVSNNMWWLSAFVNQGDLDYYLVRPVSSLFFLSLRDFAAGSFLNLVAAVGILAWAISGLPQPWGMGDLAIYGVFLVLGAFLHYCVHMLFALPVFWLHSGGSVHQIFYSFGRFMERPDRIFTGWARKALVTILPFPLMASFPARLFLDGPDWKVAAHMLAVVCVFFGLVVFLWNRGLRAYSSASS